MMYLIGSPYVSSYITAVKEDKVVTVFQPNSHQQIYKKVKEEAMNHYIKPIDAHIDSVWKGIPGYNGREVDIEATYKKMLAQKNRNQIPWVYKEIKPGKTLDDLGAVPIYRGNKAKKSASLMINVAWGTEYLDDMLRILRQEKVKTTFFLDGSWLSKNAVMAKKIIKEGHEIGNHAYSHPLMSGLSNDRIFQEIKRTEDVMDKNLRIHSKWFAPPAGDFDQRVVSIAYRLHMKTVLWTLDTVDWKKSSLPEKMIQKINKNVEPGSLILMHPTDRTVEALPFIIKSIKKKGLIIATVSDTLSSKRLNIEPIK